MVIPRQRITIPVQESIGVITMEIIRPTVRAITRVCPMAVQMHSMVIIRNATSDMVTREHPATIATMASAPESNPVVADALNVVVIGDITVRVARTQITRLHPRHTHRRLPRRVMLRQITRLSLLLLHTRHTHHLLLRVVRTQIIRMRINDSNTAH